MDVTSRGDVEQDAPVLVHGLSHERSIHDNYTLPWPHQLYRLQCALRDTALHILGTSRTTTSRAESVSVTLSSPGAAWPNKALVALQREKAWGSSWFRLICIPVRVSRPAWAPCIRSLCEPAHPFQPCPPSSTQVWAGILLRSLRATAWYGTITLRMDTQGTYLHSGSRAEWNGPSFPAQTCRHPGVVDTCTCYL